MPFFEVNRVKSRIRDRRFEKRMTFGLFHLFTWPNSVAEFTGFQAKYFLNTTVFAYTINSHTWKYGFNI
jgi:hypothetical protein